MREVPVEGFKIGKCESSKFVLVLGSLLNSMVLPAGQSLLFIENIHFSACRLTSYEILFLPPLPISIHHYNTLKPGTLLLLLEGETRNHLTSVHE